MTTTIPRTPIASRVRFWLGIASIVGLVLAAYLQLLWAPPDANQGEVQRVMYVHVSSAWLAYLAFVVVFLASLGWLATRRLWLDAVAVASAEIGVLFTGMTIVLGSIWARPTWGVWWTWEPRLITTAIMFFMYVGYLLLRGLVGGFERRATLAAIVGAIAVINVPIVHFSVEWMNSQHQLPTVLRVAGPPTLDGRMLFTLIASVFAFTLAYAYFMTARVGLELDRRARAESEE